MSLPSRNAVVIVAAGRGERIGSDGKGPKQYRRIGKNTILFNTIKAFCHHPDIDWIQPVIHRDDADLYAQNMFESDKLLPAIVGGATRQESCAAGIFALSEKAPYKILIHDGARPFVLSETISAVLKAIVPQKGALPVHAISETVKRIDETRVIETVPRDDLACAQTPQGFVFEDIMAAHQQALEAGHNHFTDDAAVAEWVGMEIVPVHVSSDNLKITTRQDLQQAHKRKQLEESKMAMPDVRSATGYDVHQTCEGDHVVLCGLKIPHDVGLAGHSDADVGLHSLTDALLGTIGAGDIGSHFPPSDPQWKDAGSDRFLRHAVELMRAKGGTIANLDVTLICEGPKIGPHRDPMRQRIAEICEIDMERVSVKATTNERIGFIGRNEGIAAIATASVVFKNVVLENSNESG